MLKVTHKIYSEIQSLHLTPKVLGAVDSHCAAPGEQLQFYVSALVKDTNRSTWRKPVQAQGEHANSTQEGPDPAWY